MYNDNDVTITESTNDSLSDTEFFNSIIDRALYIFENGFSKIQHQKKIKIKLMNYFKEDQLISSWI